MPAPPQSDKPTVQKSAKPAPENGRDSDYLQDQEKIIDGRADVNYPALLTKDVPGG